MTLDEKIVNFNYAALRFNKELECGRD